MKAFHAGAKYLYAGLEETGIDDTDFRILEVLLNKGPLPVNTIGPKVNLTPGSISTAVDRLVERDLVSRVEHFALSLPTSVVITGIDSKAVLDQAFEAARTFAGISKADIAAILQKAKPAATGEFEPFKTSAIFDSTAAHPEWLGYNPQM
jgi:DNA-binding Lrp family transcriptional regulator